LSGKTIGTPLWAQTAAIWIRGHLQHDYGVDLGSVRWVQGAVEKAGSHGNPPLPDPREPIDIVKAPPDKSLNDMLAEGSIDALIGSRAPDAMGHDPAVGRLFPDYRAVERAYFQKTGIHPIMHCVAIRRSVFDANPWIARSLYDAFSAAKDQALDLMRFSGAQRYMLPWLFPDLDEIDALFGGDPWPYGTEANRPTLTALVRYMAEQGMIPREVPIEDLFVPVNV
jgi:4,5-dihydroxyphthalate decarboxylase